MKTVLILTKRNILMFVKDRAAAFFSLLSALIIIGLYVLFLAETNIRSIQHLMPVDRETIAYLVNSWVMGGIIAVNSLTVPLGMLGIMVNDETKNRMPGFLVSPISRVQLTLGYIFAAFIIGNALCILTFILSQAYIAASGGSLLTVVQVLKVLGITLASVFSSTCLVFFVVSFIRSASAFSAVSVIVGSLIGFAAGVYLPVGELPDTVQKFMKCIPVFYDSSLIREVFMENPVAKVFKGAPPEVVSSYLKTMGVRIYWGSSLVSDFSKTAVILLSGVVFLILSALVMRKRRMVRV